MSTTLGSRSLVLVAVAWLATACSSGGGAGMLHLPPPPNWERDLLAARASKDDWFRTSRQTPLPAAAVAGFAGLDYFAPDPGFYLAGRIEYYESPERLDLVTTAGQSRPCERIGRLVFELGGAAQELHVYRMLDGDGSPFLPFTDATSGNETYPAGRYVDLDGPPGGSYVLDFNRAYNPSCAYGEPERFACPVTPRENRLSISIRAGERGYPEDNG